MNNMLGNVLTIVDNSLKTGDTQIETIAKEIHGQNS
jgi:hypothetical protein